MWHRRDCRDPGLRAGVGAVQRALGLLNHRGPDDIGLEGWDVAGLRGRPWPDPLGDHRPHVGWTPADGDAGRPVRHRLQRRDLQLPGAAPRARGRAGAHFDHSPTPRYSSSPGSTGDESACTGSAACSPSSSSTTRSGRSRAPATRSASSHFTTHRRTAAFAFASEVPALLDLVDRSFEVNHRQAYRFLHLGFYDESAETFIDGIYKLRPGSMMEAGPRNGPALRPGAMVVAVGRRAPGPVVRPGCRATARAGSRLRRAPHAQRRPARYRPLRGDRLLRHRRGHASSWRPMPTSTRSPTSRATHRSTRSSGSTW